MAAENATILKISDEELAEVARLLGMENAKHDDFAKALAAKHSNLRYIIITLGGEGAYALDCAGGKEFTCPSEKVAVVSTVGAGDSFGAAFLHKLFAGGSIPECLQYASKVAAFVVSQQGAVPEYTPTDFQ